MERDGRAGWEGKRRKEEGERGGGGERGLGRRNRTTYGKRMMEMMRLMMEKEEGDKVRKKKRINEYREKDGQRNE